MFDGICKAVTELLMHQKLIIESTHPPFWKSDILLRASDKNRKRKSKLL